ncbi:hypothetical protein OG21DRAFT_699988 [Imleria badia]|nr:hypothetical protein OG21DRAFT_699988 [Imleria badia]
MHPPGQQSWNDDRFLVIGGEGGIITVKSLSPITDSIPLSRVHPTFQEPDIQINDAALDSWKRDQLADADALLTTAIFGSQNPSYCVLASRALVRAHSQQWDTSLVDAEMSIQIKPSVIGYIAKSVAHVFMGERDKAYQACDIAFERFHSSYGTFILLIKAIIVFMAGEERNALSRVDDLIATVHFNSICYVVQAYMYLLLGNSCMETSNFKAAIQSFKYALAQMRHHTSRTLFMVSLVSKLPNSYDFTVSISLTAPADIWMEI